jgi:two-component system, chemotaxis family, protein-glutamate methylesterase/glutaminase
MSRPAPKPVRSAVASTAFDVVVIGASAGGLNAVEHVLKALPPDFPAAVIVVQHLLPDRPSYSVPLLAEHTHLSIKQAEDGDRLRPGTIYVAPPDSHLLFRKDRLKLGHGAEVRFSRPSIDVTFESAATAFGARCIGVVLSGANRDGADGVRAIKAAKGAVLVQDPADAEFHIMPAAAAGTGCADRVLPLADIGPELSRLCASHAA